MGRLFINAFQGRIPKLSAKLLELNQAQIATNCDLRSGEIKPFKALNQTSTLTSGIRSANPIDSELFSSTSDCDFVRHDVSGTPVLIVSDGSTYPKQYTDALYPSDHRRLGVVAPTDTLTITFGTIGGISSTEIGTTVSYVYTYVTSWGEESAPSPATAAVDVQENQYVTLTNFTTPDTGNKNDVTGIRIYRLNTGLAGAEYQFLEEVDDATTSYDDYDTGVGLNEVSDDTLETEDWIEPPSDIAGICRYANGMLAGFSGNTLCISEPFIVYAWPTAYQIDFDADIVGIKPFNDNIVVCTEKDTYIVTGNSPESMVVLPVPIQQVCVAKRSMVETTIGVVYASHDGLVLVDGAQGQVITKDIVTKEQWQDLTPEDIIGFFYDDMYLGFFKDTNNGFVIINGTWIDIELDSTAEVTGGYNSYTDDKLILLINRTSTVYTEEFNNHDTDYLTYTWKSGVSNNAFPSSYSCGKIYGQNLGLYYLDFTSQTGSFSIGSVVYGATSGAYGTVYSSSSSRVYLYNVSGTFQDNEVIYVVGYGSELITAGAGDRNLNFSVDAVDKAAFSAAYDWVATGNLNDVVVSSNVCTISEADGGAEGIRFESVLEDSKFYKFVINVSAITGQFRIKYYDTSYQDVEIITSTGIKTVIFKTGSGVDGSIFVYSQGIAELSINAGSTNNSLKQVTNAALASGTAVSTGVSLKVYGDSTELKSQTINNQQMFRLPGESRYIDTEVYISGISPVESIILATSTDQLKMG